MRLSDTEVDTIIKNANNDVVNSQGSLRFGQSLWNATIDFISNNKTETERNDLEKVRGSDIDPFYNDAKVQAFLNYLQDIA